MVRRTLVEQCGGFRRAYDGAQDYDFIFRCVEGARRVGHVPRILYHWRTHKASTADNPASKMYAFEAGKRAIEGNLERCGVKGAVVTHTSDYGFYNVTYPVKDNPLISIIIPNKDQRDTPVSYTHLDVYKRQLLFDRKAGNCGGVYSKNRLPD